VRDRCNDVLFAAIPLNRVEREQDAADETRSWPGGVMARSARLIRGLGLDGELACAGHVGFDPDGRVNYDFELRLEHGIAQPTQSLAGAMGAAGILWPAGFSLEEVSGRVQVSRDGVRIDHFTGQHEPMMLSAEGMVDLHDENTDTRIDVTIKDMPIGAYVINLAPPEQMDRAKALWDRYEPHGTFGATLNYSAALNTGESTRMSVYPSNLTVLLDQQRIGVQRTSGDLLLEGGRMEFANLSVDLSAGEQRSDGHLTISGQYNLSNQAETTPMRGSWVEGRFESPLITEVLHLMGEDQAALDYKTFQPSGSFDATFSMTPGAGDRPADFLVSVQPRAAAITVNQTPIYAEFEKGQVVVSPGVITLHDIAGRHAGGSFAGAGAIKTTSPIDVDVSLSYDGRLVSGQVLALLPEAAREALRGIQFNDGGPSRLTDGRIHLMEAANNIAQSTGSEAVALGAQSDPVPDEQESLWAGKWITEFTGKIETRDASFVAGLPFTELDGVFDLAVKHQPGSAPQLNLYASTTHMRVLGQELKDGCWPVELTDNGQVVSIPWFRANASSGVIDGQARFGMGDHPEYQAQVNLVGIPLEGFRKPSADDSASADSSKSASDSTPPSGEVYASIGISGLRDEPASRVGRGVIRVLNGRMASVPLLMQMVKLTQFTAPVVGEFNGANIEMYLKGDRVIFEHILFESTLGNNALLQLIGEGEMNFDTLELNTRFRSRGGVAVVRDIVGGVSDQLYQIEVTGPLSDPKARVIALPGMSNK
jgi:hypothetical protein